jgi:hypothetical protein
MWLPTLCQDAGLAQTNCFVGSKVSNCFLGFPPALLTVPRPHACAAIHSPRVVIHVGEAKLQRSGCWTTASTVV